MKRKRNGFTLIEIMIVVAIVALLAAIAIPNFVKYRNRARLGACTANLIQIARAFEAYMMENDLTYTADTSYTAAQLTSALVGETNYLKEWPACGSAGVYSLAVAAATEIPTASCTDATHPSATAAGL